MIKISGEIYSVSIFRMGYKRSVLNVRIKMGDKKLCVGFFNQAFRIKQFVEGEDIAFEGVLAEKNGWLSKNDSNELLLMLDYGIFYDYRPSLWRSRWRRVLSLLRD